ncbi:MAG: DUF3857 and transglutaminase domain-containing protein [Bdellovibrionaceae bacterium]|nr:DUF3857 and transglutaminase domain-containing protein [Pseudobdellovibrionaceae bacterium]
MKNIITLLILVSPLVWGRLQKPEEASHRFLKVNQYYKVDKTGQYKSIIEFDVEILNETGRREYGFYKFTYPPYLSRITEIEASTKTKDNIYEVEKKFIEDKPVASNKDGFDNDNQVSIAFPNVQVGSILSLRVSMQTHTLSLENFFGTIEYFGWRENSFQQNLYVESEKELFFHIVDPLDSLDMETKKENGKYYLNVSQKKPIFINPVEEKESYLTRRLVPHVEVSTEKNWSKQMMKPMIDNYESVLSSPLPTLLENIYGKALAIKSDTDRIEYIIEQLQTHIRYLGDWRSVKGAMIPRALAEVARSGYGDCKDYSASLTAILRKLGYTSHVAWVYRGDSIPFENPKLPSLRVHNHAITYLEVKGKSMWLDATNNMVYIAETLPDIAGRTALILDSEQPREAEIPSLDYKKNKSLIQVDYSNIKGNYIHVKTKLKLSGISATEWTGDELRSSKEALQFRLLEWTSSNVKTVRDAVFEPFSLISRISRDLEFNYEFKEINPLYESNDGLGFLLWENQALSQIAERVEKRFSDLGLNYPRTSEYRISFKNASSQNVSKLNCSFKSDWVVFDRKVSQKSKSILIHDTISVLKNRVPQEAFNTPQMTRLLNDIRKCVIHKLIVLN